MDANRIKPNKEPLHRKERAALRFVPFAPLRFKLPDSRFQ